MSNQHQITWVVVADKCQANIYHMLKYPKLEKINRLEHLESGLHNQDLISSKPGHNGQRAGVAGYSYQPETEPKQLEASKFATELAHYLSTAEQKGEFHRLYIFADPSFLGFLRPHISKGTQKTIVAEVPKELTSHDITSIEKHISSLQF